MKKEKSTAKKVVTVVVNVIIWLFVAFAAFMTVLAFASLANPDGVPSLGNSVIISIRSDSMKPTFSQGDIIIAQKVTDAENLAVGDIITFSAGDLDGDGHNDLNSHRIVSVDENATGETIYYTKGDANLSDDPTPVSAIDVICLYDEENGVHIKGLGNALNFLQQPKGFLLVIVLPMILFFIYEIILFIRKFLEVKNSGKKQITAADEELIRQRAVEEYIRSQQMAADAEAPAGVPVATPPETPTETPAERSSEE